MFRMTVGHSDDVDLGSALEAVFAQCDAGLAGAAPTAGLLIVAWGMDHQFAIDAVRARYPGIELAGSSSAGEMSSELGFREDSVALVLFASDSIDIVAGLGRDLTAGCLAAAHQAVQEATAKTRLPPRLCIVLSTIGGVEAGVILQALRTALGPGVPILGGGAAPRDPSIESDGASSREFAGDVVSRERPGHPPVRRPGRLLVRGRDGLAVRRSAGDDHSHLGGGRASRSTGDPRSSSTSATSASASLRSPTRWRSSMQPDSDRFYLRTPTSYDRERGSIGFFGAVPDGASVQLTMAGTDQIVEGAQASIADALASFPDGAQPDGALLFSCATRKFLLGTRADREIELVRDGPWRRRPDRRPLLHGRDRADGVQWMTPDSTTRRWCRSCSGAAADGIPPAR